VHVKVKIKQGQGLRLGLDAHREDLIKNKELKNKGYSNLNVKVTPLVHVKVEIEQSQGLESRVGLRLNVERENLIANK
jgi:hypothetical protein